MTPLTLAEYLERERRNPKARPVTQDEIGAHRTLTDDQLADRLAARNLVPVKLNPHTRRPRKPDTTLEETTA